MWKINGKADKLEHKQHIPKEVFDETKTKY